MLYFERKNILESITIYTIINFDRFNEYIRIIKGVFGARLERIPTGNVGKMEPVVERMSSGDAPTSFTIMAGKKHRENIDFDMPRTVDRINHDNCRFAYSKSLFRGAPITHVHANRIVRFCIFGFGLLCVHGGLEFFGKMSVIRVHMIMFYILSRKFSNIEIMY